MTILLGAYTADQVDEFEASLGQKLALHTHYGFFPWTHLDEEAKDIAAGRIPILSWSPGTGNNTAVLLTDVTAGKYDAQLNAQAAMVIALGAPIWIRLFYEMTGTPAEHLANPTKDPSVFVAAYRHIVDLFRAAGVTNVSWVWAPGFGVYENDNWPKWYPGTTYVDFVAEDHYWKTDTDFPPVFEVDIVAAELGKPAVISETGAVGVENQVAWLEDIKTAYPSIYAFCYWNAPSHNVNIGSPDYRFYDPAAFAAFKAIGT